MQASSQRIGGIATFLGCARDFSEGREVLEISFDAYGSMAVSEMNRLRDEAMAKFQRELPEELVGTTYEYWRAKIKGNGGQP